MILFVIFRSGTRMEIVRLSSWARSGIRFESGKTSANLAGDLPGMRLGDLFPIQVVGALSTKTD